MSNSPYITSRCPKCQNKPYSGGTHLSAIQGSSWAGVWTRDRIVGCASSWLIKGEHGGCVGCGNIGMVRCLVLTLFMCKLGIKVKEYGDGKNMMEAIAAAAEKNRISPEHWNTSDFVRSFCKLGSKLE